MDHAPSDHRHIRAQAKTCLNSHRKALLSDHGLNRLPGDLPSSAHALLNKREPLLKYDPRPRAIKMDGQHVQVPHAPEPCNGAKVAAVERASELPVYDQTRTALAASECTTTFKPWTSGSGCWKPDPQDGLVLADRA